MDERATISISRVDIGAAAQKAQRLLSSHTFAGLAEEHEKELERFVSIYFAARSKGIEEKDALEVGSGLCKNGYAARSIHVASLEEFLGQVSHTPEYFGELLAGLHESFSHRVDTLPIIRIDTQVYKRASLLSYPTLIGCDAQRDELVHSVHQLFCYDTTSETNPESGAMHKGALLYGPPGTGKSSLCTYVLAHAQQLSLRTGTPFRYTQFSPSDYSMWMGESSKHMKDKLENVSAADGVGVLVVDDLDMVLQGRQDSGRNHGLLQVTAQLMQHISGVTSRPASNMLVLATTNRVDLIDDALLRRLTLKIEVPLYESLSEYAAFVDSHMPYLTQKDQKQVASYGLTHHLSPADLANVSIMMQQVYRGDIPQEIFDATPEERFAQRSEITPQDVDVTSILETYRAAQHSPHT